jgi:hypothetical protein
MCMHTCTYAQEPSLPVGVYIHLLGHECASMCVCTGEYMCDVCLIWACGYVYAMNILRCVPKCLRVYSCREHMCVCLLDCLHGCTEISVKGDVCMQ